MATVGAVWINVLPSMQGFAKNLERQATSAAKVAAAGAGQGMGNTMADSTVGALRKRMTANSRKMQATFTGSTNLMTRSLANFTAGWRDADAAASAFTGRMGTVGQRANRALLAPGRAVGQFASGFGDANAAASAFGSRMTVAGGQARSALERGIAPLRTFAHGFTDARVAASALSGQMGTLGGVAGRTLGPFVDGFRNADAAASAFTGRMGALGGVARRATDVVTGGVARFGEGFNNANVAASAFSGRLGTLGGMVRSSVDAGVRSVGMLGAGFQAAGSGAARVFGAVRTGATTAFSAVTSVGGKALTGIRSGFTRVMQPAREASGQVGGLSSTLGRLGAIGGAALGAIGIGAFTRGVYNTATAINEARASLTGMYGDADQANAMVASINDEFARSSVGVDTLNALAANLAYLGLEGEGALQVIRNIDTAAGALPGDAASAVDSVSNALLTAQVQGNAFTGELNQISRIGFPIFDALAQHIGVTSGEIKDMASQGEISFEDLMAVMNDPAMSHFWEMTEASAKGVSQTFSQTLSGIGSMVRVRFAEMTEDGLNRLAPGLSRIGDSIEGGLDKLPETLGRIRDTLVGSGIVDGFWRLVDGVKDFGAAAMPALRPFGEVLGTVFGAALRTMGPVGDFFSRMAGWMRENAGAVKLVGAALGGLVVGIVAVRTVTMAWAVVQSILNAAMAANPIGLIVIAIAALVAGIVYAYKNFEGFRNVVDTVWQAIKNAAMWIWERGLKPAFEGIRDGVRWVGDAVEWLWKSAIKPAWDGIVGAFDATKSGAGAALDWFKGALTAVGDAAMWLWEKAIKPTFDFIWALLKNVLTLIIVILIAPVIIAVKVMGAIFKWLWTAIIKPVFNWIGDAALWLWNNAIKPAWDFIVGGVKQVGQWFKWLWENGIKPVINWIADGAKWLWNNGIKPAWDFIVGGAKQLATWFKWLWSQIKAVFNWIAGHIKTWWNRTKAQFNLVVAFIRGGLSTAFTWFRDRVIKPVWDFISRHISNVWNNGIKPAFDKVKEGVKAMQDAFGRGKDAIKKAWDGIRDSAKKPINFLIGTVYNKGIMPLWNKVADVVGATKLKEVAKFATGGPVYGAGTATSDSIPALLSNQEHVWTAREVAGAGGHGAVEALRAQARAGGSMYARGGAVGFPNSPNIPSAQRMLDALKDFVSPSGLFSAGVDLISGNYSGAIDKVLKPAREITGEIGTKGLPGTPHLVVKKGGDLLKGKIKSLVDAYNAAFSSGGGSDTWVGIGSASERLRRAALWADTQHGLPYQWGGGGNPSWDCSGFMAGIENVIRGIRPGRRYTTHSFAGTPPAGWVRNLRSPFTVGVQHGGRGGGHMAGTLLGKNVESGGRGVRTGSSARGTSSFPHRFGFAPVAGDMGRSSTGGGPGNNTLYDRGGYMQPGTALVSNRTGRPEPVLTSAQWRDMHQLATSVGASEGGELMRDAHIHLENSEATVQEAFRRLDTELRKRRRGGVHAGRTGR